MLRPLFKEWAAKSVTLHNGGCDPAVFKAKEKVISSRGHLLRVENPDHGQPDGQSEKDHAPFAIEESRELCMGRNCRRR